MADKSDKYPENRKGKFYVDRSCIACDACVTAAPDHFSMDENDGHAFLSQQPQTEEQIEACKEAMEGCPVEAIGDDGEDNDDDQAGSPSGKDVIDNKFKEGV